VSPAVSRRGGFTLVELAVTVFLILPVALVASTLAVRAAREAVQAAEIAGSELGQEVAAAMLEAEVAPLAVGDGLLGITAARIRVRARRAMGRWCILDSIGVVVPTVPGQWAASRLPVAGRDSAVVVVADSSRPAGMRLLRLGLTAPPSAATCPGGAGGLRLPLDPVPTALLVGDVVQVEEVVELAGYNSAGATWLGVLHLGLGTSIEPVAGPFGTAGVVFTGYDANGQPTTVAHAVRLLQVDLGASSPRGATRRVLIRLRG